MTHRIFILDVFAERPLEGNQLAVVLDGSDLSRRQMQAIARETNFSETTFVVSDQQSNGGFEVRIFTPTAELPFAGHPTLGTSWLIRRELLDLTTDTVTLNLGVGQVPVSFGDEGGQEVGWLRAPASTIEATFDPHEIAPAVGLLAEDLESGFPPQLVTAGLTFLIVPLRSADALSRVSIDVAALRPITERGAPTSAYLFCPEPTSADNDLAARFFFDSGGIREDPATGSATGALGGYLLHHDYFSTAELSVRIEQGRQMGRPSLLRLRSSAAAQEIFVGGRVFEVLRGELL